LRYQALIRFAFHRDKTSWIKSTMCPPAMPAIIHRKSRRIAVTAGWRESFAAQVMSLIAVVSVKFCKSGSVV
jgi:hypothetical protein